MGQLKHFLGGLVCTYFGRKPRRALSGAQPLTGRAQERRRKHLERCASCRVQLQRERQYLERLRGAAVPAASEDLTARLLARTGALAAGQDSTPEPAPARPGHQPGRPLPSRRAPVRTASFRIAAQIAGGVAATAALMGGAAYLMGAETALPADDAFSAAFPGTVPSGSALSAGSVSGAAWKLSSEPDVAPAGALSSEQLSALRAGGWTCPELRELGYHLVWARGGVANGSEVLELRLTDGRHFATVLEQHAGASADRRATASPGQKVPDQPTAAGPSATPPVNVLTGHLASEDGFVPARAGMAARPGTAMPPEYADAPDGALWVNRQAPFSAIYRTSGATFTYVSDLPADQADDGVGVLLHGRPGPAPAAQGTEGVPARLERGLERIVGMLAR